MNDGSGTGKGTVAICPICGNKFRRKHKGAIFCDRRCSAQAREEKIRQEGKRKQKNAEPPKPRTCEICGTLLVGKRSGTKYCGPECKKIAEVQKREEKRAKMPVSKCEQCGSEFFMTYKTQRFCSKACAAQHNREGKRKKGPKNQLRKKETLVMVVKELPVIMEMRPKVGKCYLAEECLGQSGRVYIIPEIGKYGLIVREDEAKVLQGV